MKNTNIDKVRFRVPRASNLRTLKLFIINSRNNQTIDELTSLKATGKSYLNEYISLLYLLGWINKSTSFLSWTDEGKKAISRLSNELDLTINDKEILKNNFMKLDMIKKFMENVFNIDTSSENLLNNKYLSKEDIYRKYISYRNVRKSVAERESRTIYNWLLNIDVIESIKILDSEKKSFKVYYHLIGNKIDFIIFSRIIKLIVYKALKIIVGKSDWVEIPVVRTLFCIENNISKQEFNNLFLEYINKNPHIFQLSTATSFRKEVENEGLFLNKRYYFYVKLI